MSLERFGRHATPPQLPANVKPAGFIRRNLRLVMAVLAAYVVALVGWIVTMHPNEPQSQSVPHAQYAAPTPAIQPLPGPRGAENGDRRGRDNDGDGRKESTYVEGYRRADGTVVKGHYRAAPKD